MSERPQRNETTNRASREERVIVTIGALAISAGISWYVRGLIENPQFQTVKPEKDCVVQVSSTCLAWQLESSEDATCRTHYLDFSPERNGVSITPREPRCLGEYKKVNEDRCDCTLVK